MKLYISSIIFIFIFSCKPVSSLDTNKAQSMITNGYKVIKIDSINNVYLIYAIKRDSLFKILSLKNNLSTCNKIKIGKQYNFELQSLFPNKFLGKHNLSPNYLPNVNGIDYHGTTIKIERDSINDLHYSSNIKGLCYIKTGI